MNEATSEAPTGDAIPKAPTEQTPQPRLYTKLELDNFVRATLGLQRYTETQKLGPLAWTLTTLTHEENSYYRKLADTSAPVDKTVQFDYLIRLRMTFCVIDLVHNGEPYAGKAQWYGTAPQGSAKERLDALELFAKDFPQAFYRCFEERSCSFICKIGAMEDAMAKPDFFKQNGQYC